MAVFTSVTEAEFSAWLSNYSPGQLLEMQGIENDWNTEAVSNIF